MIERGDQKHFVYQQSVVCTNAFIEKYLQYVYDPKDITTHLWELFDMIVVDEDDIIGLNQKSLKIQASLT